MKDQTNTKKEKVRRDKKCPLCKNLSKAQIFLSFEYAEYFLRNEKMKRSNYPAHWAKKDLGYINHIYLRDMSHITNFELSCTL